MPSHSALRDSEARVLWTDTPDAPAPLPPLEGTHETDLLIVGGGFTGLWAALTAKERDPSREVVLLEGETIGFGASSRNGGFLSASLTHGHGNGIERWPAEMTVLERLGRENHEAIRATIERHGIDARLESAGQILVANEPHQVPWLDEAAAQARQLGWAAEILDREAMQAQVHSPLYLGGMAQPDGEALVDPARLVWGLRDAVIAAGVRIFDRSLVTRLTRNGAGLLAETPGGTVRARRAVLATNAFPPLARRVRQYIAPVYDYVIATEPLDAERRGSLGWTGRQGLADMGNRFHYYRLTPDDRLVWGGFDAVYYYGGRVLPRYDENVETFDQLARNVLDQFPQLEGVRFTHRWGGAIDTCSRFAMMFVPAFSGRAVYVGGFTGLGVGASRFGAMTALDLADGRDTERTRLELVRTRPIPFPPEPLRYGAISLTRRALVRADENAGRRGPWLRTLDRLGLGFDS